MKNAPIRKLKKRFVGPFFVVRQVGPVAYELDLPQQLFRPSMLQVGDPAAAPGWLLGASPLPCRGRNRGARSLNAQWWARSCDRSDVVRLARPMGRGDGVLRGHTSGHQQMRLHDGACGLFIWPLR